MSEDNVIIELKLSDKKDAVKAFATVTMNTDLGELTISGIKVIQKEKNEAFVALPNIRYKNIGKDEYKTFDIFTDCRKFKKALSDKILAEYSILSK